YKALSYMWGPEASNDIILNDKCHVVRDNLYEFLFLESLNRECEGTRYWIDQLCIDQRNVQERNHQVAQMVDIYSSA
ncbi:hypothetical protein BDW02DRAFT_474539, partial [Decorospora gaudefroyi]